MISLRTVFAQLRTSGVEGLYTRWLKFSEMDPYTTQMQALLTALPDDTTRDRGLARACLTIMNQDHDPITEKREETTQAAVRAGVLPWSLHRQFDELTDWVKAQYRSVDDDWKFVPRRPTDADVKDEPLPPLVLLGQILNTVVQHYDVAAERGSWMVATGKFMEDFILVWPVALLWLNAWVEENVDRGMLMEFAMRWSVAGYAQLVVHQPVTAAFALTDVPDELIPEELPWTAFRILMPKSPLIVTATDYEGRVDELWIWQTTMINATDRGPWMLAGRAEWTHRQTGVSRRDWWTITSYPSSLAEIVTTVRHRTKESQSTQLLQTAMEASRALVNVLVCVAIQLHEQNFERAPVKKPPKGKRWRTPKAPPVTTDYVLGKDIRVHGPNLAPVVEAICRGERKYGSKQWMVRGHKRAQAHGPRHTLRKTIWIQPFWKGPVDAPILKRSHELEEQHEGS